MSQITPLFPRQQVPQLSLPTIGGATWTLYEQKPEEFNERGVDVTIASSDTHERAEEAKSKWGLDKLNVAYCMSLDEGRKWGLYISTSRGKTSAGVVEPDMFLEPGIFLIRPNQELYFATVQTKPFAHPSFAEILGALDRFTFKLKHLMETFSSLSSHVSLKIAHYSPHLSARY